MAAHHHVVPGLLPASPTLTNPDMILPYEFDSTPSPKHSQKSWQGSDIDFSLGPPFAQIVPLTPTTPIIYGNGTMLSDIGEVTEAESTPGQRTRPEEIRVAARNRDLALRSSPTMGYNAVIKRTKVGTHERKVSTESTSTVTSHGQAAELFEDFDDAISIDDSNFQGDDEESVFEDEPSDDKSQILVHEENDIGLGGEDRHSSAALSRRAEMILANAKRRLDTMEGNLTRARSSFHVTPSNSISSINSSSPLARNSPSPPQGIVTALGAPPSRHRPLQSPGHSRISSENNLPSTTSRYFVRSASLTANEDRVLPSKATTRYPVRSASAAAVLRETSKPAVDNSLTSPNQFSVRSPYSTALEPLGEDDTVSNLNSSRTSIAESYFSSVTDEHRALTRSTSSMQMRDLRDQMKDLKGKISSLRDRAREENMKRRSLQSLRTPSPFTAAEQWYTQGTAYNEKTNGTHEIDAGGWNGEASDPLAVQPAVRGKTEEYASFDTVPGLNDDINETTPTGEYITEEAPTLAVQEALQSSDRQMEVTSREDSYDTANEEDMNEAEDMDTESGSDYGDEVVDYEELDGYPSENESLYHESLETPVSHEDREDAFDYQNFFLHSAMGSLSRTKNRRNSIDSYSSDDSVETARGIAPPSPQDEFYNRPHSFHERKASADSISTMATFATANEGQEEEEVDDIPDFGIYPAQLVPANRSGASTPLTARRDNFPDEVKVASPGKRVNEFSPTPASPPRSVHFKPQEGAGSPNAVNKHTYHHPSVSSFSSFGTARSFPLVKPKTPTQTPSPISGIERSPRSKENINTNENAQLSPKVVTFSEPLQTSVRMQQINGYDRNDSPHTTLNGNGSRGDSPVNMLAKDDQILVERVVASLGKCVLGMQEVSRGGTEGRMWRRRLDAARKILDGGEDNGVVVDI